ncbi:MAG: 2-amino-4-hydroxy-6-hydroxymethyldihydropteridine diphosphokinase [Bacillaceae bacterium]
MNKALIGLGSNIGNRLTYLKRAVELLHEHADIHVKNVSSLYETEPVGYTDQEAFLNMVVQIYTNLNPNELLAVTQSIELELGRERKIRWGPRTIDLDILAFNHENINSEKLIIPHPRIGERAFVLVPLKELSKDDEDVRQFVQKYDGVNVNEEGVDVWKRKNGGDVFALFEN